MRLIEREAEAEHAWPALPAVDQRTALRAIEWKIPQNGKPVRMLAGRLDRQLIGVGVPARWMNHGRVDARFGHLLRDIVLRIARYLSVRRIGRQAALPDMDLRVDNQHNVPLLHFLAVL